MNCKYHAIKNSDAVRKIVGMDHFLMMCITDIETSISSEVTHISKDEAYRIIMGSKTIVYSETESVTQLQCYSDEQNDIYNIRRTGTVTCLLM